MKTQNNFKKEPRMALYHHNLNVKGFLFSALILLNIQLPVRAQEAQFTKPSWWIGGVAGLNLNYYRGTTQQLNSDFMVPTAFHHGKGMGLFLGPLVEFHRPDSRWGVMVQEGFDSRRGSFESVVTPCNCVANLSTKLSYFTVEPSLRFAPFKSKFYLYAGPRFAFNVNSAFTYKQRINAAFPEQVPNVDVKSDFSNMSKMLVSMQIGAGYDIPLSASNKQTQIVLSPFASFQPYFGQNPRSIETWTVTTIRVGAALKFGRGHKIETPAKAEVAAVAPEVKFSVNSPENIPVERRVRETFPVRNYVFFNLGSTAIPDRYVLITKDQVKDFKEDQLEVFKPKSLSGRSDRQMIVYYNILNILGDRMSKNPETVVHLAGSSMQGKEDGLAMAETVKRYLVDVFGIEPSRITTEGRIKPAIPSEQPGATTDLDLLREGDRRVSIWSESPGLMMEFQSGPDAPLKPVEIVAVQTAPLDSYVSFSVDRGKEIFTPWSLEFSDENGQTQFFGPYTMDKISIPGKSILGNRPEGDYKVTLVRETNSGKMVRKDTTVHMVLWSPPHDEEGMRFTVLFEYNNSKAIAQYDKYLTDIVAPKIPQGATVLIHGYTDIIGDEANNQNLSNARAADVLRILKVALGKAGRMDVKFESYGFGEDQSLAQFGNKFPEERFYNRSVIIDIIPNK